MALEDNFTFVSPDFGKNPINFFQEVREEISKVHWPSKKEVVRLTVIVVAASVLVGLYLGGLDLFFTKAFELLLAKK